MASDNLVYRTPANIETEQKSFYQNQPMPKVNEKIYSPNNCQRETINLNSRERLSRSESVEQLKINNNNSFTDKNSYVLNENKIGNFLKFIL